MKPRIRMVHGVWCCWSMELEPMGEWLRRIRGHGYTPLDAYREWQAQVHL